MGILWTAHFWTDTQFQKKPIPIPWKVVGNSKGEGGGGVLKAKFLEAMYENKLEFPAVRVMQNKKPSVGGVWIFSGTAQVMEMHPVS